MSDKCPIKCRCAIHKNNNKTTNKLSREINDISERSASRDLEDFDSIRVLNRIGEKKGAF